MVKITVNIRKPTFHPGECVSGQVILENEKGKKQNSKFLKISIFGEVCNDWTESDRRSDSEGNSVKDYYWTKLEIINQYKLLWKYETAQKIPTGTNVYDFKFFLPSDCPPTFQGIYGNVTYKIMAVMDRPWKFNLRNQKDFEVIPILDLRTIPNALCSLEGVLSKNTGLIFKNGIVEVTTKLPKSGYIPGEHIPISIMIANNSSMPVSHIKVKLCRKSHHSAYRDGCSKREAHHKEEHKRAVEIERKVEILTNSKREEHFQLMVPYDSVQSFGNSIMSNEYFLQVKVKTTSTFKNSLLIELPVIVGTVHNGIEEIGTELREEPQAYYEHPPTYEDKESITKFECHFDLFNISIL